MDFPQQYALAELLVSMFDAVELRLFAAMIDRRLADELPGEGVPLVTLSAVFVDALRRRGMIDEAFRAALRSARPRRAQEIEDVLGLVGFESQEGSPSGYVFLSYANEDFGQAQRLARGLELHHLRTWIDRESLLPGDAWMTTIEDAIRGAMGIVVLLTKNSIKSGAIRGEISLSLSLARRRGLRIVPVVVGLSAEEVPPEFHRIQWLRVELDEDLGQAAGWIVKALAPRKEVFHGTSEDPELLMLVGQFMRAAARSWTADSDGWRATEPVHIQRTTEASMLDVQILASRVVTSGCGYLVYRDDLLPDVQEAILDAAIAGKTLVPLSERQMQAALADSRAREILDELTIRARGSINLFEASNSIQAEWEFFGRSGLLQAIGDALARGQHIYLTGTRKAGKTSFLNLLRIRLATRPCVAIDLQAYGGTGDWTATLLGDIVAAFDRWASSRFGQDWQSPRTGAMDRSSFVRAMRDRCAQARAFGMRDRVLLFMDELERIEPRRGEAEEARRFVEVAAALRALAQGADACLSIIVADLRPEVNRMNVLKPVGTNPFFEFFQEIQLPNWSPSEVAEMVRSLARRMGVADVGEEFAADLHALSGGHARLARMLAAAAWQERADQGRLAATDLTRGLEALADRDQPGRFFAENFWGPLTAMERVVLLVAARQTAPERRGALSTFWHRILRITEGKSLAAPPAGSEISAAAWSAARGSLRDQSILEGDRVAAAAFQQWLAVEKFPAREGT